MKKLRKHQSEALVSINNFNEGIIHLPTGSGKTFIQASAVINSFENNRVYVVLSPRILLTNQLYSEVKEMLYLNKMDCQYLIVHSGKAEDRSDFQWTKNMPYREVKSTTSSIDIKEEYERSVRENVPLIIFGTYDSSERIVKSGIPVYMLLCDEAHYIVTEEFNWIRRENLKNEKCFNAERKYYFTATLKTTASDTGLGMNNSSEFGEIIYSKTPLDMVLAGEILRPRIHLVDTTSNDDISMLDKDVNAIIESFTEHRVHCNIGAKVLVVTKGSEHLNDIVNHPKIKNLIEIRRGLKVFDISSAHKPRINGEIVKRDYFLKVLQSLRDEDEAIILHVKILTEGIDVPGITGVMIMNNQNLCGFLQTLGRATRLYKNDRTKLYDEKITYDQLNKFTKPFAWVIVPVYGVFGQDLRDNLKEMIYALRSYGFNAAEDVVIKESKGKAIPIPLSAINVLDTKAMSYKEQIIDIVHEIEDIEKAEKLEYEDYRDTELVKSMTNEELIKSIL